MRREGHLSHGERSSQAQPDRVRGVYVGRDKQPPPSPRSRCRASRPLPMGEGKRVRSAELRHLQPAQLGHAPVQRQRRPVGLRVAAGLGGFVPGDE
jgi:hypothetical protein